MVFYLVGSLLDEGIGVRRKAAGGGEEQALMSWAFGQKALDELEAEREGVPYQLRVAVRGKRASAAGQGVAELVDGDPLDRAGEKEGDGHRQACHPQQDYSWFHLDPHSRGPLARVGFLGRAPIAGGCPSLLCPVGFEPIPTQPRSSGMTPKRSRRVVIKLHLPRFPSLH